MATWVSWPKLELAACTELAGQPASIPAGIKDPPSAFVAVCGNKSPDHDQNRSPTPACTWGHEVCLERRGGLVFCLPIQLEDQRSHPPQGVKPRNVAGSPARVYMLH